MVKDKRGHYIVLLVLTVYITAFLSSGCGAGIKSGDSGDSIEYASMWEAGESQAEFLRQVAGEFEKETGIKVKLLFYSRAVLKEIKGRIIMGDPPDLVEVGFNELYNSASQEMLKPADLTDMFYNEKGPEGQERLIDIFTEEHIKLYEINEKLYMFPYEFLTSGFFYDKTLFAKYDLKPPVSWDEFIKNNEVLKREGVSPLALDLNAYTNYYYCWTVDRLLGPGSLHAALADATGNTWDNPGYLKAAELVYNLGRGGKDYFQEGYEKNEWPLAQIDWARGKYGNILCYTWIPDETRNYSKEGFEYGFYPFPEIEGGNSRLSDVEVLFIGCVIPEASKNISAAKAFLKFMSKKESAEKFVKITNNISAREDVEYPEVLASVKNYVKEAQYVFRSGGGLSMGFQELWNSVFTPLTQKLILGDIGPDRYIRSLKEDTIQFWSQK